MLQANLKQNNDDDDDDENSMSIKCFAWELQECMLTKGVVLTIGIKATFTAKNNLSWQKKRKEGLCQNSKVKGK